MSKINKINESYKKNLIWLQIEMLLLPTQLIIHKTENLKPPNYFAKNFNTDIII